jgi:hypothetical protein
MSWTVHREPKDFINLDNGIRLLNLTRRTRSPDFPQGALFPPGFGRDRIDPEVRDQLPMTLGAGVTAGMGSVAGAVAAGTHDVRQQDFQMMQKVKLQEWLVQLAFFLVVLSEVGLMVARSDGVQSAL